MHRRMVCGRLKLLVAAGLAALVCSVAQAQSEMMGDEAYYDGYGYDSYVVSDMDQQQAIPTSASYADLEARIQALEAKLQAKEAQEQEWEDVSGEKFSIKVGGRIYGDLIMFASQDADSTSVFGDLDNYFEFRRIRIFIEGEGYGVYDYKIQFDWEPEEDAPAIKDLYVGMHDVPYLGYVRFGHFKEPFGLEMLTSSKYITFMERANPTNVFAPERNVGICAFNHSEDERFTWAYGVFTSAVDEEEAQGITDNLGVNFTCRGTWNPVYTAEGRGVLHLGWAYSFSEVPDNMVRFHSRPSVHEGPYFLDTGWFAARNVQKIGHEAALVYGPFSVQSEFFWAYVDGINGVDDYHYYGAYVYGSWFLTGENRVYKRSEGVFSRVKPYTNFFLVRTPGGCQAGWGAWELACRWSYLELDEGPNVGEALYGKLHDLTVGVNWYWNPYTRMMFNWIHAFGDLNGLGSPDEDILGMRLQVDF